MLEHNEFNLYLIRHGQTETNVLTDMLGQTATSQLTEKGRWQAQMLHDRLIREDIVFDRVFSSDYDRAIDTANIVIANKTSITLAPSLREYDAGDWMHASRAETYTLPVVLRMAAMTNAFVPPNGESMHMVERRASQWLEDAILYNKDIQSYASERITPMNIAVFSHGMTIKCLLSYVMGFDRSFTWRIAIDNTSITKLHFGPQGWRLLTINDHAHLLK